MPYIPRVLIWNQRYQVSYPAFQQEVITEELWSQTTRSSANTNVKHDGLAQTVLSLNKQLIEDPLLGQRVYRPKLINLEYKTLKFEHHGAKDWVRNPRKLDDLNEEVARANSVASLSYQVMAYKAKMGITPNGPEDVLDFSGINETTFAKLSADEQAIFTEITQQITIMQPGNFNFLTTDTLGQGTYYDGIFWLLGAPNIPVSFTSLFKLEQDRAFSFRLTRFDATKIQAHHQMILYFGKTNNRPTTDKNPNTLYALVWSKEEGLNFWHFKNIPDARRLELMARRETILDTGRLTAEEMEQIANLKVLIGMIKPKRKSAPSGQYDFTEIDEESINPDDYSDSLQVQLNDNSGTVTAKEAIEIYKKAIKDIKEPKANGLSDVNKVKLDEVETALFYAKEPVTLSEDTNKLIGLENDYTVIFDRRGYIYVKLGTGNGNPWTYENKGILKTGQYGTMLPKDSRLTIESNGGSWQFVYGNPDYNKRGSLWLPPFKYPTEGGVDNILEVNLESAKIFDLSDEDLPETKWKFNFDAIGIIDDPEKLTDKSPPLNLLALPGCKLTAEVIQLKSPKLSGTLYVPGEYQLRIEFYSDGRYTPQLTRAQLYLLAGEAPPDNVLLWDSLYVHIPGSEAGPFNPYDPNSFVGNGGTSTQLIAKEGQDVVDVTLTETENVAAAYEVIIRDMVDKPTKLPLDLTGRSIDISFIDLKDGKETFTVTHGIIHSPKFTQREKLIKTKLYAQGRVTSQIELGVSTIEDVANRPIECQIVGNNKLPNVYFYELLINAGLRKEEMAFDTENPIPGMLNGSLTHALPPGTAGQPADIKPELNSSTLEFINSILTAHYPAWKMIFKIDPATNYMKADLVRWGDVNTRSDLQYSSSIKSYKKLAIRSKIEVVQDTSDYYTSIEIKGGFNPATNRRYSAKYVLYEATDQRFRGKSLFYVSYKNPFIISPNDSLKSDLACQLALRSFRAAKMRPPYKINISVILDPTLHPGTLIFIDGIKCVVESVSYDSIKRSNSQFMHLVCNIMEDLPLRELT